MCRTAATMSRPHQPDKMRSCSEPVTSSRISSGFQRRVPGGRHDLIFKVAFGSNAAAARSLRRSKMTIWRWRHDRSPLPNWVTDVLEGLVQTRVEEAHAAQAQLRDFRRLPPRPPRPLSGACAGYFRKPNIGAPEYVLAAPSAEYLRFGLAEPCGVRSTQAASPRRPRFASVPEVAARPSLSTDSSTGCAHRDEVAEHLRPVAWRLRLGETPRRGRAVFGLRKQLTVPKKQDFLSALKY